MPAACGLAWAGQDDDAAAVAAGAIDPLKPKVCAPRKMYKKRGRCRSQSQGAARGRLLLVLLLQLPHEVKLAGHEHR